MEDAKARCDSDPNCGHIRDESCAGKYLALCSKSDPIKPTSDLGSVYEGSCIYSKTGICLTTILYNLLKIKKKAMI